jgi:hypothetical protein
MKNSTSFFVIGYILFLGLVGMICFPGETQSQATASLFVANVMGFTGLGCMFLYKREHQFGR